MPRTKEEIVRDIRATKGLFRPGQDADTFNALVKRSQELERELHEAEERQSGGRLP